MYRLMIACVILFVGMAAAMAQEVVEWTVVRDVNALDDLNVTPNSPALNQALTEASQYVLRWTPPESPQRWLERKEVVRQQFLESIGLTELPEKTPLDAKVIATHDMGGYTLSNVVFFSRPGFPVTANLYRPKKANGKLPAVVCPIGHWLDIGKRSESLQTRCIKLVNLGYVVLIYDAIGHGERALPGNSHHEAGFALLPVGQTVAGWMVWDSMRAYDYLCTLPEVDSDRIGITGNSGGGLNCLFTSAVDHRFAATALAGYVFHFNNWIRYSGPHCTCTGLPELYREMEWFEIAGLISPSPLLMMQGSDDQIFPISGARIAGRLTESVYSLEGAGGKARFHEIAGFGHGYYQPFREAMYGWMEKHLAGRGDGGPIPEMDIKPLPPDDPRLFCDKDGKLLAGAKTVVDFASEIADTLLTNRHDGQSRECLLAKVAELTAPPTAEPHYHWPEVMDTLGLEFARLEKVYFLSEIGQYIPGLLWLPMNPAAKPLRTVLIVDSRGKAAVAESNLVRPIVESGRAVLSVDLRGRGETLGRIDGGARDNNYHYAWFSVLWGQPLAGRRAFDISRTLDYIAGREELTLDGVTVVGLRDEVPAVLLAAASDKRIAGVVCTEYVSTFRALLQPVAAKSREEHIQQWNPGAMQFGIIDGPHGDFDLGGVIPDILRYGDIPELVAAIAPRPVLYGRVIDGGQAGTLERIRRFQEVIHPDGETEKGHARFYPDLIFDAAKVVEWISDNGL